jgi:diguanylate cyclase (GGDEF)-like protein/PAS domain S-box-containing protein
MEKNKLRSAAEARIPKKVTIDKEELEKLSLDEVSLLFHELKVHQIELEMQNEELQRIQDELSLTKMRYFDLYDLAPDGYIVTSYQGIILESNLTATNMLGLVRSRLQKQRLSLYILSDDRDFYFIKINELLKAKNPIVFDLRFEKNDGSIFWVSISATLGSDKGVSICKMILRDVTERHQFEIKISQREKDLLETQRIAHVGSWRLNVATDEVKWTEELYKMYGFDPAFPPPSYTEHMKLFTPESWELLSKSLAKTRSLGIPYELELQTVTKDGSNGWMWVKGEAEKDEDGRIVAIWGAAQDITEQMKNIKILKESEELLDMFFKQSLTGFFIMMVDKPVYWNDTVNKAEVLDYIFDHQRYTRVNQAMLNQYGMNSEDFFQMTPRDIFAHDTDSGKDGWKKMLDYGLVHVITDQRKVDGTHMFIEGDYVCMYDSLGRFVGHFGNQQDVTTRIREQREIEYLSNHDYLTGLMNRRYYFEQFKQLDKPENYPLGIMMFDVNGLKIVNDAFGHAIGDIALQKIGNVLKETFKQKTIISRIGGDEFAVLLPNISLELLQQYKDQLKLEVNKQKIENIELSLAIGYELKKSIEENCDEILKLAENRMYRHKSIEGSSIRKRAISAILQTLTEKYDTEREHSERVSHLCRLVGQQLKLREDELNGLEQAGMFHDIGKISIPDSILDKPGRLTDEEYDIIKTHTEVGYQILRAADEYSDLAIHALHHHERWDGKGYPSGLKGKDIPLFSRIIGVADAYEAMTAVRLYRPKMSKENAISEIKKYSGTQFDPKIASVFVEEVLTKQDIK